MVCLGQEERRRVQREGEQQEHAGKTDLLGPGGELTGQGSTCPGQCLRRPWSVRVLGDPPGFCKKRPCLEFSLEQEGLKLRQLLDSLSLDSHVCCGLEKLKGHHMGPPDQTKGSPEPFSRGSGPEQVVLDRLGYSGHFLLTDGV